MKLRLPVLSLLALLSASGLCVRAEGEEGKWNDFILELVESLDREEGIENLYNDLSALLAQPLDLNRATRPDLERYPFLSDRQIDDLMVYLDKHGPMVDVYELRLVPSFDYKTISYFLPFVRVEERIFSPSSSGKPANRRGKHQLLLRADYTLQQKKGYLSAPSDPSADRPEARYRGEPFYHYLKYDYHRDDHLQLGLLAEKDMGEPLFSNSRRGYDFYSAHFVLRNRGRLNTLAVGHYRASFGQGLIMNSDFSFGKSSLAFSAYKRGGGIKRHFSTDESNYLQGASVALNVGQSGVLTLLYSIKSLDGIADDSSIVSIKTDGLHRLERDEERRNIGTMQAAGANFQWNGPFWRVGATGLYYLFSKPYHPTEQEYNSNYFRGTDNFNVGVVYELQRWGMKWFGETALSKSGGVATLNGCQFSPLSTLNVSVLQRYYGPTYHAYYSKAFGEASQVIDEAGLYMAAQWSIHKRWTVSGYLDVYRFDTPHYGVDAPASGYDYQLTGNYIPSPSVDLTLLYRHQSKPKNHREPDDRLNRVVETNRDRVKAQLRARFGRRWTGKTSAELLIYAKPDATTVGSLGWMVSQQVGWLSVNKRFQIDLFGGWFHTDDYNSRVYSAEKSMLYTFSVPSFYGHGVRGALHLKAELASRLSLTLKYAHTHYFDRLAVGTDLEEISVPYRDDLYLLLRWSF